MTNHNWDHFWSRIDKTTSSRGCWLYLGFKDKDGYGIYGGHGADERKVHRMVWTKLRGTIPAGLLVLHRCPGGPDRACCNPDHLYLGTFKDNAIDTARDGHHRSRTHPELNAKGMMHPKSKLTDAIVKKMRRLHKRGMNHTILGRRYGVTSSVARKAVLGITWGHISE